MELKLPWSRDSINKKTNTEKVLKGYGDKQSQAKGQETVLGGGWGEAGKEGRHPEQGRNVPAPREDGYDSTNDAWHKTKALLYAT